MTKRLVKIVAMGVLMIMSLGLFAGCSKKITNFDGLKDLPKNPSRLVYATNLHNEIEDGVYGELIEYEIERSKIAEITEKFFVITYNAMSKNIAIDMPPITRLLFFYNDDGVSWEVRIGLQRHNGRWYAPNQTDDLIAMLDAQI